MSGAFIKLTASDGHVFEAYQAGPVDAERGLVVIQEIFGVNAHIREVCEGYAQDGFRVLAPALFDRAAATGSRIELSYNDQGIAQGRAYVEKIGSLDKPLPDIEACLSHFSEATPVSVVGYCWGGTLAWLSATRLPRTGSAVGYYGGGIPKYLDRAPQCPVILHFAEKDKHIPISDVDKIRAAYPNLPIFTYDADHGFNCEHRSSYHAESAKLARTRTLEWIQTHP